MKVKEIINLFFYLNIKHPSFDIQERTFWRDVKHDNNTISTSEVIFGYTSEPRNKSKEWNSFRNEISSI